MTQKNKITMIGSGALATAIAKVLYHAGNENITIYGVDQTELNDLKNGSNSRYFPNSVELPNFETTSDLNKALDGASYVFMAVPSKFIDVAFAKVLGSINSEVLIINGTKGFFPDTEMSVHEGLKEKSKSVKNVRGVVSLIGPSHAEEIVLSVPTVVSAVCKDETLAKEVQGLFKCDFFKTYIQTDVKGAEVGAAYKNVLAIISGMAKGLGFGINTNAALLTRGLAEMARLNKALGGKPETIMGLTGIGDLIVTATSELSRNFTFGMNFAKEGKKALETNITVEGLSALDIIYKIAVSRKLDLPIVLNLYECIHKTHDPKKLVDKLWQREDKSE